MKLTEAIRTRRSVRTFDGRALTPWDADKILAFAEKVENPFDLPVRWRILDAEKSRLRVPVIAGATTYLAGMIRNTEHAEEAFGYTFEKVVLYAWTIGVGTTIIAGTMDRPAFELAAGLGEDEVMPCVTPLGYPAERMSLRETVMRKGIAADTRRNFGELFFDGSFDKLLTPETAGPAARPLDLVRCAPSAVNKQPWRVVLRDNTAHFYEKRSKGYIQDNGRGKSWDIQKIDLGIALAHFETGASQSGLKAVLSLEDPGIAVPDDTVYVASYRIETDNSMSEDSLRGKAETMNVTLETVIGDIVDQDENTADIFLESGMHCITCPVSRMETVEEAAMVHGVDADELVAKLNKYFSEKAKK